MSQKYMSIKICRGQEKIAMAPLFDLSLSAEIFPKILKNSEISQIHKKKTQNENVQTIDQFSSYQILINS